MDDDGNNSFTDIFSKLGYGSFYLVQNFGTLCFTVFLTPLLYLTSRILAFPIKKLVRLSNYYHRKMFFDFWLKFLQEAYLFLGICVSLNFNYFYFNKIGNSFNSTLSTILAVVLILFPFGMLAFYSLSKNKEKIISRDKEFLSRYGSVLEGLNLNKIDRKVLYFPFIEIIRKFVLILTVTFM